MIYPGFCGPSYQGLGQQIHGDRCVNLYPEESEIPNAKAPDYTLVGTPGIRFWVTLPHAPIRVLFEQNGRMFAVAGNTLYELFSGGTYTDRGNVAGSGQVWIEGNGYQLFIVHGSEAYVYNLNTDVLTVLGGWLGGTHATGVAVMDNYFIASVANGRTVRHSDVNDGTIWLDEDVASKESSPDNIATIFSDHNELWVFGERTSEVWYNTGGDPVFGPIQGATLEVGIGAVRSVARGDNSLFWLDDKGIVRRADQYSPARVSTHAIETAIAGYSTAADARGFTHTLKGHLFYVLTFPTGNQTWVYDAATGAWHEREWWDATHGTANAVRGRCHGKAFGRDFLGDWENGRICYFDNSYILDDSMTTGQPLRAIRRPPRVYEEDERFRVNRFQLQLQKGLVAAGSVTLRASYDGGNTWGPDLTESIGALGTFPRVVWRRLGQSSDFVPEVTITDAVPRKITGATIEVSA